MFGEIETVKKEAVNFPMKSDAKEISEVKSIEIQEPVIPDKPLMVKEIRFARLKKTLRRRSGSIL